MLNAYYKILENKIRPDKSCIEALVKLGNRNNSVSFVNGTVLSCFSLGGKIQQKESYNAHEEIDEMALLSKINALFNMEEEFDHQNEQSEELIQIFFNVDEILANERRNEPAQRIANAIAGKIFDRSFIFGANCAVRIAALRILSHLCANSEKWAVQIVLKDIDLIVLRALHVREVSAIERSEALHLISAMFSALSARSVAVLVGWWRFQLFAKNVLHFLIGAAAIGGGIPSAGDLTAKNAQRDVEDKMPNADRFFAIASSILLELLARFPSLFFALGIGLDWLTRLMHKCFETDNVYLARIGTQLLANLLDCTEARRHGEMHLLIEQIFAPLLDITILPSSSALSCSPELSTADENIFRRRQLKLCAICLVDLLNTWPGFFVCFAVDNFRHSPCQSVIAFLKGTSYWVKQHEKLVGVELFCRMLCLPYANKELPSWDEAAQFYERALCPDPFRASLSENFVLAELPFFRPITKPFNIHRIKRQNTADLLEAFKSIRVYALYRSELPEALIRTIIHNPDNPCGIKATLLLADILHMTTAYLPRELRLKAHGIAELINRAAQAFQPAQFGECIFDQNLKNADLDWINTNENSSNAIKLYVRLEQIERLRTSCAAGEKLYEMHTFFLLANFGNDGGTSQQRRTSSEHSMPSRHSSKASSSGQATTATTGAVVVDEQQRHKSGTKDEIEGCRAILEDLLPKAFVEAPSDLGQQTPQQQCSSTTKTKGVGVGIPILAPIETQQNAIERHDKQSTTVPNWPVVWHILHTISNNLSGKSLDKCIRLFDQLVHHFLPSNRQFLRRDIDPLSVACAQQCFRLLCVCAHSSASVGLDNSHWAAQQVASFLLNFCAQLQIMEEVESTFCSRFPLQNGVRFYFAILRTIFSHPAGQKLLQQTAFSQYLYQLALNPSTSNSMIKLIIVSLDYFPNFETDEQQEGLFARGLLEAVLLHSTLDESIKKWATRFLGVFITLEQLGRLPTFQCWHWTLHLAFRQLLNPSLKIVRCAAKLLLDWLPKCPLEARKTAVILLKNSNLNVLGNLGMLLGVFLYGDWDEVSLNENEQLARKTLRAWKDHFNLRYVDILEERMRKNLSLNDSETFQQKRSMAGHFSRASFNYESGKWRPCQVSPEHLYGQLIRTKLGQSILQSEFAIDDAVKTIKTFLNSKTNNDADQKQAKASLLALAHLLANIDPYRTRLFVPDNANTSTFGHCFAIAPLVQLLCDCAEQHQSLCVRGFAIWAVNIAANGNERVADLMASGGWEHAENSSGLLSLNLLHCSKMPKLGDNTNKWSTAIAAQRPTVSTSSGTRQCLFTSISKCQKLEPRSGTNFLPKLRTNQNNVLIIFRSPSLNDLASYSKANKARKNSFDPLRLDELIPANFVPPGRAFTRASTINDWFYQRKPKKIDRNDKSVENENACQFMTEKEHKALIVYRKFLATAGEINEYGVNSNIDFYMKTTIGKREGIFLPNFLTIFGQISFENTEEKRGFERRQNIKRHNKWRCIFCAEKRKKLRSEKNVEITYSGAKFEALSLVERLTNSEIGTANSNHQMGNLLRLFANGSHIFEDRCLFSDVLQLISDAKTITFDTRCTLFELFKQV